MLANTGSVMELIPYSALVMAQVRIVKLSIFVTESGIQTGWLVAIFPS